jgi:hypothetical protein
MQLLPSQFYKSSANLHQAAIDGDKASVKSELPDDFSDSQIDEYMKILSKPSVTDEPLEDKSPLINYKEEYTKKFSDGFWKSVFEPMAESIELNEAITDSAKKKAIEKFKKEKPELGDQQIKYYIDKFSDKQSSNVFQKKDIFQYKFDELEKLIDANFPSDVSTKTDDDEVDFKGSEDVVYNKNGLLILLGDLKEKCIRYGKGYSWCISRKDSSNMFFGYRMRLNEPVFYFIFDEDKPKDDIYHAMVIYINKEGEYYVASSENTGDEEMSWYEIEKIQPKLKGLEKLFKHIPLTAEEKEDYKKFRFEIDAYEYEKLTYTEKEKYIGFGHDLTEKQIRVTPKQLVSKYATTTVGRGIPKDIEKSLPPSDQKKLRDNRVKLLVDDEFQAQLKFYPEEITPETIISAGKKGSLNLKYGKLTSLPDNLEVNGDLDLTDTPITTLPDNLKVEGDVYLNYTNIKSLPDNLEVGENLNLSYTLITTLPDNLKVGKNLYLRNSSIESLPDNLKVGGSIDLSNTSIESLPDNLIVVGDLTLADSSIESLPDNLKVGGDLILTDTPIESLPDNLEVGGNIDLKNSSITYIPANLKVKGSLLLRNTPIESLPDNLEVGENLEIFGKSITSLPDNLKVGKDLHLNDTSIKYLPNNLEVGGTLLLYNTKVKYLPDDLKVGNIEGWGDMRDIYKQWNKIIKNKK